MKPTPASHRLDALAYAADSRGVTAVSHHSAAYVHGLIDEGPALVHVVSRRGQHPTGRPGVIVHHTRAIAGVELTTIHPTSRTPGVSQVGVPITSAPTTVVMLAPYLTPVALRHVVAAALRGPCSIGELRVAALRRRSRGRSGPLRVLQIIDAA